MRVIVGSVLMGDLIITSEEELRVSVPVAVRIDAEEPTTRKICKTGTFIRTNDYLKTFLKSH